MEAIQRQRHACNINYSLVLHIRKGGHADVRYSQRKHEDPDSSINLTGQNEIAYASIAEKETQWRQFGDQNGGKDI